MNRSNAFLDGYWRTLRKKMDSNDIVPKGLNYACIDADVYATCVQHAFSNEKQEIMGLLIGEVDNNRVSHIKSTMKLIRYDKRPDRVEISPEQIGGASTYAEQLGARMNKTWRVLGWYHSHPHITAIPSFLDIKTQASYQNMDEFFVGIIFSVYQNVPNSVDNIIDVCCFQSKDTQTKRNIQLKIVPSSLKLYNLEGCLELPKLLNEEEMKTYEDQVTGETDALTHLHNETVRTLELEHIITHVTKPLIIDLGERLIMTKKRIAALEKLKELLVSETQ